MVVVGGDNAEENNRDGQIRREGDGKQRQKMTKIGGGSGGDGTRLRPGGTERSTD